MELRTMLARAKRGLRDDLRLHVVAIISLVVAFLCLSTALLSVSNLIAVAERWGQTQHVTIYLRGEAQESEVAQLRLVLESLQEVERVSHVPAAQAKQEFVQQADLGVDASALPTEAFPASLEVSLRAKVPASRITEIAGRVSRFGAVEEVETYQDWFAQLGTLLGAGRSAVVLLAILVAVCVFAIIGNTIRLAIANRKSEIEVLKLCGATDGFVRGPFVIEGAAQGVCAALLSLLVVGLSFLALRGHVDETLSAITGVRTVFLDPLWALGMVLGAGAIGAAGSALSLRRYLSV